MGFNLGKAFGFVLKTAAVLNDSITSMRYNHVNVPEPLQKLDANLQRVTAITAVGPATEKVNAFYDEAHEKDYDVRLVAVDSKGKIVLQLEQTDEERDALDQLFDVAFG